MNIEKWYEEAKKENYWCVEKGWKDIIITLCDKIITIDDNVEVIQVKEKFGGLRFYIGAVESDRFDEIYDLVHEAEKESFNVCENCGSRKDVETKGGWLKTLCAECRKKEL